MTSSGPRIAARLLVLTLAPVLAPTLAGPVLAKAAPQDNDANSRPSTSGLEGFSPVSYTHLTLPTIYSV